jgi:hypothetical protein
MRVGLFNANGLEGKADLILNFSDEQDIDIMFLTETWLKPNMAPIRNTILNLSKYNYELIAAGRRGQGGVLAYCRPEWQSSFNTVFTDPDNNYAVLRCGDKFFAIGYFAPDEDHQVLLLAIDRATELAGEMDLIFLGDLNARVGEIVGDHGRNARGNALIRHLDDHRLAFVPPQVGRYSCYSAGGGTGTPDLVLAVGIEPQGLTIHEDVSMGSDHRPLTFTVGGDRPARRFTRWNIRKFTENGVIEEYQRILDGSVDTLLALLRNTHHTEHGWIAIKRWINAAASGACGVLRYESFARRDFMTPELTAQQEALLETTRAFQQVARQRHLPQAVRREAARQMTAANKAFREAVKSRQTEVFQEIAKNLGHKQNAASLMKMLKLAKARRSNSGCKLDIEDMDTHANHFRNTFGGAPMGQVANEFENGAYLANHCTIQQVRHLMQSVPFGKAAGIDGIMGELLAYGGEAMITILTWLFNKCLQTAQIPDEWRAANIVPIYKKGDPTLAKNYRPIALTCVTRRLYERLVMGELSAATAQLSDFQGGFRKQRSTLDQAFCLHETMQGRELTSVLLDFRAAYDMVDRRILWTLLRDTYNVPTSTIMRLRALFDNNRSTLIINGRSSQPVANLRGLLQGSSLSPLLFNLFINPMLVRINRHPMVTGSLRTNCLAFADDVVLFSLTHHGMQALLDCCQNWAEAVGMKFAPEKCVVLGSNTHLTIYNEVLPEVESAAYLGIPFNRKGLDLIKNAKQRATKGRAVTMMLRQVGMNLTGFAPEASRRIYKTFIRPVLEYGTPLAPLAPAGIQALQTAQTHAMRMMLSAPRNSSMNAMHKLLHIEPMATRNSILNVKFGTKLHNSTDLSIPAVRLWWDRVGTNTAKSLCTLARRNPLWDRASKLNHLIHRLRRGHSVPEPAYTTTVLRRIINESITRLDREGTNISGTIQLEAGDHIRHVLTSDFPLQQQIRVPIVRWLLGGVLRHDTCVNCGQIATREHAVQCSGAFQLLEPLWEHGLPLTRPELTILDNILNRDRNIVPTEHWYRTLAQAVGLIYRNCLSFTQADTGYWHPPDPG